MKCLNCKADTNNPKFCSKSCAATYNNKKYIKRTRKKYYCNTCGVEVQYKRVYCSDKCNPRIINWSDYKLSDVNAPSTYQKHAKIRGYVTRNYNKTGKCAKCGYNKHTEICHIIPISEFDDDSLLIDINSESNLIELCPNCHWELDSLS